MNKSLFISAIALLFVFASCSSHKELAYISDAERDSAQQILTTYAHTIHPGDLLYIYVNSEVMESVVPFNQETHVEALEMSRLNMAGEHNGEQQMSDTYRNRKQRQVPGYLVDEQGFITFPVLGKINVAGLQHDSVESIIQKRLISGEYVIDPVVTVSPMNFRVSVVGEVRTPKELHITGERLTIFEALAMCGDITNYGKRENVVVIRDINGKVTLKEIDLTKKTLFDSEVYYLQQNDIIYVEPNNIRVKEANEDPNIMQDVLSYVELSGSLVRMAYITYLRYLNDNRRLFPNN
jgi:polysaccharide export outer membrane protein